MKKEIIAYLTSSISSRERVVSRVEEEKEIGYHLAMAIHKNYLAELNDLVNFVADFKEEDTDVAEVNTRYVARIEELEGKIKDVNKYVVRLQLGGKQQHQLLEEVREENNNFRKRITGLAYKNEEQSSEMNAMKLENNRKNNGGIDWEASCRASWEGSKVSESEMQELKNQLAEKHNLLNEYKERWDKESELRHDILDNGRNLLAENKELKESLTNMMDNESRLNKRVEKAELTAKGYESVTIKLMKDNEKLTGPQWKED